MDLINQMIQLDPTKRLGHNLESLKNLKKHPFFKGVNFEEVSKDDFRGCMPLVDAIKVRVEEQKLAKLKLEQQKKEQQDQISSGSFSSISSSQMFEDHGQKILIEGHLIKKNWYNKMQLRHFKLLGNGEVKYFLRQNGKFLSKGTFQVSPSTKVTKVDATTLHIQVENRTYVIIQPNSSQINHKME